MAELNITIDELTDCLILRATGQRVHTTFREVTTAITPSYAQELIKQGWIFDWSKPQTEGHLVYELTARGSADVQGRIALSHVLEEGYTHIDIIESAPWNRSAEHRYAGVGGHLIAIACKLSRDVGNDGYVQFFAKSGLIDYYRQAFGAIHIGGQSMIIENAASAIMIDKYFKEAM